MLITPTNLNIFFTASDTRFWGAFALAEAWNDKVATTYPTGTEQWLQGWIGMLDKLRVWKGPRIVHSPAPQTYGATVLPFELTEEIDEFKLADDTYGIYTPLIAHMGEQSKKWPDYQVRDLIEASGDFAAAAIQVGTDGVSHWNTAHPVDFYDAAKGTYPNDYGASGTSINGITVGGTFSTGAFSTVWQDHASRKNESGEKIGGNEPNLCMVPTYVHFAAKTILQSQYYAPPQMVQLGAGSGANAAFVGAMDNPLRGTTDLFVNSDLYGQAAWYMLNTKKVVKPFGFVLRMAPQIVQRRDPTDPVVFDRHVYLYGVKARGVPVWSLAWLSSRSGI